MLKTAWSLQIPLDIRIVGLGPNYIANINLPRRPVEKRKGIENWRRAFTTIEKCLKMCCCSLPVRQTLKYILSSEEYLQAKHITQSVLIGSPALPLSVFSWRLRNIWCSSSLWMGMMMIPDTYDHEMCVWTKNSEWKCKLLRSKFHSSDCKSLSRFTWTCKVR